MTVILRKEKEKKGVPLLSKADRLAIKLGGKRFDPSEPFEEIFEDGELDEFLKWREETRQIDLEAQRIGRLG
ncbi:MAG: hypothetical protein ABL999_13610 [Pyrinomonadaceae bacterium]